MCRLVVLFLLASPVACSKTPPAQKKQQKEITGIVRNLRDADQAVADKALADLTKAGQEAVPHLIKLLESDDLALRENAAYALGEFAFDANLEKAARAAIVPLTKALAHEDRLLREDVEEAIQSFSDYPKEAYEILVSHLSHEHAGVRDAALNLIGRRKAQDHPGLVDAVVKRFDDDSTAVRASAASAVGLFHKHKSRIVPLLLNHVRDGKWQMREACLASLGLLAPHDVSFIGAAVRLMADPVDNVREAAASSVEESRVALVPVVSGLVTLTRDRAADVRRAAVSSLGSIGGNQKSYRAQVIVAIRKAAGDGDAGVRELAGSTLLDLDAESEETANVVAKLLSDAKTDVRLGILRDLTSAAVARKFQAKIEKIAKDDASKDVRDAAVEVLQSLEKDGK